MASLVGLLIHHIVNSVSDSPQLLRNCGGSEFSDGFKVGEVGGKRMEVQ